jgi:hypothetical protein
MVLMLFYIVVSFTLIEQVTTLEINNPLTSPYPGEFWALLSIKHYVSQ